MANVKIKSLRHTRASSGDDIDVRGPRHRSVYVVEMDYQIPAFFALRSAQGLIGGTIWEGGETLRVPQKGDWFLFDTNGVPVKDTFAHNQTGRDAFTTAHPLGYADFGTYAWDFLCEPLDKCSYSFTLTFRENLSARYETPESTEFFKDFGPSSIPPLPDNPTKTDLQTVLDVPTVIGYRWITREIEIPQTYRVTNGVPAGNRVTLRNPNGQPYPPATRTERVKVVRFTKATFGGSVAIALDKLYAGTVNEDPFVFDGQTVEKHHARYLGAEVSAPIETNGTSYNLTTYEIEIDNQPQYRTVPAEGTYYVVNHPTLGDQKKTDIDLDGFQTTGLYPLDTDGNISLDPITQHVDTVLDFETETYTEIFE